MVADNKVVLRHNFLVNVVDGAFFGFGVGYASFVAIIPLFVSSMTDSALLIGLIPAIHSVGWQLPQLILAGSVARQTTLKPMVLLMTIHERLPYLGLVIIAWLLPKIGPGISLALTFALLIWQGLGAGFTANPWQSMIAKIIPADIRGTFIGIQAAAANLLASVSAVLAGVTLDKVESPLDFTICFMMASSGMLISWFFLAATRESRSESLKADQQVTPGWADLKAILLSNTHFRWFLVVRSLFSFATMAFAFYTVYLVRDLGVSESEVGLMVGIFTGTQIAANPLLGWLSDRWNQRYVLIIGALATVASAAIAWWAPLPGWFYLVFVLAGFGNVTMWTIGLTLTLDYGSESERPYYIGLANTVIAPSTLIAPFIGGWLADQAGYQSTFIVSSICGIFTILTIGIFLKNRHK